MIFFDLNIKEIELFINNSKFATEFQITANAKMKICKFQILNNLFNNVNITDQRFGIIVFKVYNIII